jgi:glutamate--cysteine ligase
MRTFLPTRGSRAVDMMQRTATVQVNLDYASEADAMRKLVLLLRISPLLHAMTANSPFIEGRRSTRVSERGDVWLHMDPSRSGLIPALWRKGRLGYEDYVEWALDAPMFLFRRGDQFIKNTGQTFRSFLADGFQGHRAEHVDWVSHVNSLFPEARLKRTLEVRACDSLPHALAGAVPALAAGLVYDPIAFDRTWALVEDLSYVEVEAARPAMVTHGLRAELRGKRVGDWCRELLEIARGGLERRQRLDAAGQDERVHLRALAAFLEHGRCPADALLEGLPPSASARDLERRSVI